MSSDCLAELSGVSKRFGTTIALDDLYLEVRQGELLALLGSNGAGKSTAISLLLGLQQPTTGSVRLFGQSPLRFEARRQIGVMMQEVALAQELRVIEQIELVASYYPHPLTSRAVLQMTGTESLAKRPYGTLSGGQKRQAQFAMAVCGRPKLLFLDEPMVGLDVRARETMRPVLRKLVKQGTSIVLTTHYLEEAEALADRVAVLAKGRLVAAGTVNDIRGLVIRMRVTCATALSAEQIARWAGVESVTSGPRTEIIATDAELVTRQLLAADPNLRELEIRRAGLAEALTVLTEEAA